MIHGYKQMILATLIAIFASDIPVLQCYPYGAPESACTSLKPSHSGQGNEGPSPFDIILSQQEYLPGDTIQGKIHVLLSQSRNIHCRLNDMYIFPID